MCGVPGIEDDKVTIILAVALIQKTEEAVRAKVMHPEPQIKRDKVWYPKPH